MTYEPSYEDSTDNYRRVPADSQRTLGPRRLERSVSILTLPCVRPRLEDGSLVARHCDGKIAVHRSGYREVRNKNPDPVS